MQRRELLKAASLAAVGLSAFPLRWMAGAEPRRQKVLYFTRSAGFEHSVVHRENGQLRKYARARSMSAAIPRGSNSRNTTMRIPKMIWLRAKTDR